MTMEAFREQLTSMSESKSCEGQKRADGHPARERDVDRDNLGLSTAFDVQ